MSDLLRKFFLIAATALCAAVGACSETVPAATEAIAPLAVDKLASIRKAIASTASLMSVAPDKIIYLGLDEKPITEAVFYESLRSNAKNGFTASGKVSRGSDEEFKASESLVVRLTSEGK
jgi:hypothetical protein